MPKFMTALFILLAVSGGAFAQSPSPEVLKDLTPTGKLRAAMNFGNPVLVQKGPSGEPPSVSAYRSSSYSTH